MSSDKIRIFDYSPRAADVGVVRNSPQPDGQRQEPGDHSAERQRPVSTLSAHLADLRSRSPIAELRSASASYTCNSPALQKMLDMLKSHFN